ncbi:MAG: DUF2117 domain-containing protein [Candidatus Methanofastidiosa archaeon]|nr:DUF2117 domain-containing protein [Candidatus Methanofastidiosa archaeon]
MKMHGERVVLFHGPDVFDKGHARNLVNVLGEANFYQAGTMGRTAAHDNGLDMVISIPDLPGKVIGRSKDIGGLIIAICPRTANSGKSFVKIILDNAGIDAPVMHLDFRTMSYVVWQGSFPEEIFEKIRGMGLSPDQPLERIGHFIFDGKRVTRYLQDTRYGDFVLCNNIIIGKAIGPKVSITAEDGRIVDTNDIDVKEHGIEKLVAFGHLDILKAKCCSTSNLREDAVKPRIMESKGNGVVFIHHAGTRVFDLSEGCEGVVAIGDDTSRIVGDILYRFRLPVIAITDGDRDGLIKSDRFSSSSVIYVVDHDDDVGNIIQKDVFLSDLKLDLPFKDVKEIIHERIADRVIKSIEF